MIFTQIIITIFVFFAISRVILRFKEGKISLIAMILWLLVWSAVETIIWIPELTTTIARILGIGRGADFIVYGSIVVIFYLIFRVYIKLEDIERQITTLTRKIALQKMKK